MAWSERQHREAAGLPVVRRVSVRAGEYRDERAAEIQGRMKALGQLNKPVPEEMAKLAKEGAEKYGPFAPFPCRMSPKDVKFKRREDLPRIRGVGEVEREERLEALHRLARHCSGEDPVTQFVELDGLCRVLLQVPRAHAVTFHRNIIEAFDNWIKYMPCGRGTVGAQRKAYMKARQFLSVLKP